MGNHTLYIAITLSSIYIYGFRSFLRNGRFPTKNLHFGTIGISKLKTSFEGAENFGKNL